MICTVFNADMIPTNVVTIKKAIKMVFRGKHVVVDTYPLKYKAENIEIEVPKMLICKNYVKLPAHFYGHAKLTAKSLKVRDHSTCQYCGRKELKSGEFWTRDHITPQSKGGEDVWENVVLCCNSCNNRKDDKTPKEAGMTLISVPKAPTRWELESLKKHSK